MITAMDHSEQMPYQAYNILGESLVIFFKIDIIISLLTVTFPTTNKSGVPTSTFRFIFVRTLEINADNETLFGEE